MAGPDINVLTEVTSGLDRLVDVVAAGELRQMDQAELIRVIGAFEQIRNRLAVIDHEIVRAVESSGLLDALVAGRRRGP